MRSTAQLVGILISATLAWSSPGHGGIKGTWNFDGTCGGFPEAPCSSGMVQLAGSWGEADLASCAAVIAEARNLPFPSQIALASTKPRLAQGSESDFLRIPLDLPAAWINSGVWTDDGSLLLVDSWRGELLRLSASGIETVDLGLNGLRVSDLRATEKGFILKLRDGRFVALDRQGRLKESLGPLTSEAGEAGVQSLVNWIAIGDWVLSFGDLLDSGSNWTSGWLRVPLRSPASFSVLRSMPVTLPERKLYQLGYPYAASIGPAGYFLVMDKTQPQLIRVSPDSGATQPLSLPSDLLPAAAVRSSLPKGGKPADIVARYQILEKSSIPAGLYSQGGDLYLLVRRPVGASQTEWELVRLDPKSGKLLGKVSLPTRSNHLLVIPGKELWAVIEKGSVEAPGAQDLQGLLLIPARWIEGSIL